MFQDHVTAIFIILYRLIYVETRLGIITFNKQYPCICIEIGGIVRLSQIERRKIGRYVPMEVRFANVNSPVMESVSA